MTAPRLLFTITGIGGSATRGAHAMLGNAAEHGFTPSLVAHAHGRAGHLRGDSPACELLRGASSAGQEVLLGGFSPLGTHPRAEFHRLGRHESLLRLTAAQRQLAELGIATAGFAPTRWLASPAAVEAAGQLGLGVAADLYRVHNLAAPSTQDLRVYAFGDGCGVAGWWRRHIKNSARRIAGRQQDIRLSVSARKACREEVRKDVAAVLDVLAAAGYRSATYGSYVAEGQTRAA